MPLLAALIPPVGYNGLLFVALAPFLPPQKTFRLHVVPCTTSEYTALLQTLLYFLISYVSWQGGGILTLTYYQQDVTTDVFDNIDGELGREWCQRAEASGATPNYRNGYSRKRVKTQLGEVDIKAPRDRKGSFEPKIISKYSRNADGISSRILSFGILPFRKFRTLLLVKIAFESSIFLSS